MFWARTFRKAEPPSCCSVQLRDSDQSNQPKRLARVRYTISRLEVIWRESFVKIVPRWKDIDRVTVRENLQLTSGLVSNPRRYVKSGSACRRTHSQNRGTRQGVRGPSTARPQRSRNRPPVSSPRRTAGPHRPIWPRTLYIVGFPSNRIPHLRRSGKASTAGGDLPALRSPVP